MTLISTINIQQHNHRLSLMSKIQVKKALQFQRKTKLLLTETCQCNIAFKQQDLKLSKCYCHGVWSVCSGKKLFVSGILLYCFFLDMLQDEAFVKVMIYKIYVICILNAIMPLSPPLQNCSWYDRRSHDMLAVQIHEE